MFEYFESLFNGNGQDKCEETPAENAGDILSGGSVSDSKTCVIAIANQKGGCGKTTTSINLSAGLARMGFKVLVIDLDAQSQSSLGIGINAEDLDYSIYDVMVNSLELELAIVGTGIENLDIVPASALLTGAQLEIANILGREWILRSAINKMIRSGARNYDYIIMDCSPSLNLTTINGLACSRYILIPSQTHYFSLEGMKELLSTIEIVRDRLNPQLKILGILPTLYDIRTRISRQILGQMRKFFGERIFRTAIRTNIKLVEAQVHQKCIYDYAPNSNGTMDYLALSEEVVQRTRGDICSSANEDNSVQIEEAALRVY